MPHARCEQPSPLQLFSAPQPSALRRRLGFLVAAGLLLAAGAAADPWPPDWNAGAGGAIHYAPVAWPTGVDDGDGELAFGVWIPHTMVGSNVEDEKIQDPSNGGTSPQNYVNISSGCIDLTLPSIFVYWDSVNEVLMFRWRVEQIAHTYATGPSALTAASSVDPWKSAQWTVLIDTDGDGYREFAAHIDGSSGTPGEGVDNISFIWSDTPSQSVDYVNDPNVCLLGHNPTAFTDGPGDANTGRILNFQEAVNPTNAWPNGNLETLWDYGTTRARKIDHGTCIEYFIDYQIPLAALDATACGGPALTTDSCFRMFFATANSLTDPLQKDVVIDAGCEFDPDGPPPVGDLFCLNDPTTTQQQPLVQAVSVAGCGPATLQVTASDSTECTGGTLQETIVAVDFYYWEDTNANGQPDDAGSAWTFAAAGVAGANGAWSANWDSTLLALGQILIGVRAEDTQGNVTWSHLTAAQAAPDFANPSPDPGVVYGTFSNYCGTSPSASKSASVSEVVAGGTVDFTITVNASLASALQLTQIDDLLPSGWTYDSDQGGSLSPTTSPAPGASGTISWTFTPAVNIPAGSSETLIFRATAPAVVGTYNNVAQAITDAGTLTTNLVQVGVGAPQLTISKVPDVFAASPGDAFTYTITYANNSPVGVTNAVLTDTVPTGLTYVPGSCACDESGLPTLSWTVGDLPAGSGPFTVSFQVTVDNPYPLAAAIPVVNTAEINSDQTGPDTADASVFINAPRPDLAIQKDADLTQVTPPGNVVFTITYANVGNAEAYNVVITDPIPAGWNYVSCTGGCLPGPPVTWNLGLVPAGFTGAVTLTLQSSAAAADPTTNTAFIDGTYDAPGLIPLPQESDDYDVGITQGVCSGATTYYFRATQIDVGAHGLQYVADTTAPSSPTATRLGPPPITIGPVGAGYTELVRWYQDPPESEAADIASQNVTVTIYVDKSGSPQAIFRATLYDYDPATGTTVQLAQGSINVTGTRINYPITIDLGVATAPVTDGHRMLWVVDAGNNHASQTNDVDVLWDGTGSPSSSSVCRSPLRLTLDKQVNLLSVVPGTPALTYTIKFASTSKGAVVSGAQIVDALPAGVTYSLGNATLNGVAVEPQEGAGCTTCTFDVSTSDLTPPAPGPGAGVLSAGQSGQLTVTVAVDPVLAPSIFSLVNNATLRTTQVADLVDAATTTVLRPRLTIQKSVDDTLLNPTEVATFTLTISSVGRAAATNLVVTDDLNAGLLDTYFTYVAASCAVDTTFAPSTTVTNCSQAAGVLTATADQLAVGETLLVTFQLQVLTAPAPPAGVTWKTNSATVYDDTIDPGTPVASNTVSVAISSNPNLAVTKATPAGDPVAPGEVLTYTLTVENVGWSDALDVVLTDPIPANSTYVQGSLTYDAVGQTDEDGDDVGSFDAAANQVVFDVGTMAYGDLHTLTFQVVVDEPLAPAGTLSAPVDNTMTADASNTSSKQASADRTAQATPGLNVVKTAPAGLRWPLTTLAAAAAASTTIQVNEPWAATVGDYVTINGVDARITAIGELMTRLNGDHVAPTTTVNAVDASAIAVNDWLQINGTTTQVTAKVGNTLTVSVAIQDAYDGYAVSRAPDVWTLSAAVTDVAGANVLGVITYTIDYVNTGDATLTNVTISDPLPANTTFVAADGGGVWSGPAPGQVDWSLGTLAPGEGGTVHFWARPTVQGNYTNTATLASNETGPDNDSATTSAGGLVPTKVETVAEPVINAVGAGAQVTNYVMTVANNNLVLATGVEVTDTMEPGFTFNSNVAITCTGACLRTAVTDPALGDNPATWCCWDLPAGETLTIEFVADIADTVDTGTYQNLVEVTSDNVQNEEFDPFTTTAEDVDVDWVGPNHVVVSSFDAAIGADGTVVVSWRTDAQLGTVGFYLLRWDPASGGWEPVRDALLPALASAPQGGTYRVTDGGATAGERLSYFLVEVETSGGERYYGPFEVVALGAVEALPKAAPGAVEGYAATPHPLRVARQASGKPGGARAEPGRGLRIAVREPGLYRVGAEEIAAALGEGEQEVARRIRSHDLELTVEGRPVAWTAAGDHGQAEGILFYGQGTDSMYTGDRIYLLAAGRGTTMDRVAGPPPGQAEPGASFLNTLTFAEDHQPLILGRFDGDSDFWFWDYVVAGQGGKSFGVDLPGAVAGGSAFGGPQLTVRLKGAVDTGSGHHRVRVVWNGVALGERTLVDFESAAFTFPLAGSLILDGANTLELVALPEPDVPYSIVYLDRIEVRYRRSYASAGPALEVANEGHDQLTLTGFATSEVGVYETSDPEALRMVQGARVEQGPLGDYQVSFRPASATARYLAVTAAGIRSPAWWRTDYPSDLRRAANQADYLVIAPVQLRAAAEQLAEYRESQGLVAMVVDLDDVMDEFSSSQLDPRALGTFLAHAWAEWAVAPRYVVLAGEGTFDYKDAWGLGTNLLPPVMVGARWGLYPSDNRLADLNGDDGIPEVAIGRIPAETPEQLIAYVDKLIAYELGPDDGWTHHVAFVADNPDPTGQYTLDAEALAARVPAGVTTTRIYLGQTTPAEARAAVLATLNAGVPLFTYLGHAGFTTMAHEGLLRSGDVPALSNAERLAVVPVLGCYLGNFALPGYPTLGEDLVLHQGGGAAAVWAPTGLSYNPHRVILGEAFLEAVFAERLEVLGDAVLYAFEAAGQLAGGPGDILLSQVLLGDPALRIKVATPDLTGGEVAGSSLNIARTTQQERGE